MAEYTKYSFNGTGEYNKRRIVLKVFQEAAKTVNTFAEFREKFNDVFAMRPNAIVDTSKLPQDAANRYFVAQEEQLSFEGQAYFVSTQWGKTDDFFKILEIAKTVFQFEIVELPVPEKKQAPKKTAKKRVRKEKKTDVKSANVSSKTVAEVVEKQEKDTPAKKEVENDTAVEDKQLNFVCHNQNHLLKVMKKAVYTSLAALFVLLCVEIVLLIAAKVIVPTIAMF
ncbi:MAG: hypothetical protein IJ566_03285 [Cardiobacteriaceae bacterium]|nr:hypothetical protein [Cardiobacteriaceae bacterium]